jgi:hypothetical protein
MRGKDERQLDVFSYINPEQRIPQNHPLRPLRTMADGALQELKPRFIYIPSKSVKITTRFFMHLQGLRLLTVLG